MENYFNTIEHITTNHYHELIAYPNVVGVGVSYKIIDHIPTSQPAICVMVSKKEPIENLHPLHVIPSSHMGFATDVIETGEFLSYGYTGKIRPMQFGYSVGILGVNSAGTASCKVRSIANPQISYILSNNHVLANENSAPLGSFILQPSQIDGGTYNDRVAMLSRFIPIKFKTTTSTPINTVDCAIAQILNPAIVTSKIAGIGTPKGIASVSLNETVKKCGRTTGLTTGHIIARASTVLINYGSGKTALFTNQIVSNYMSAPGDSGSLLLDVNNMAVGLLFAGSSSTTVYNPISSVLKALNVALVTS